MTGKGASIRTVEEKSLVTVCQESAKMLDFWRIGVSWGLSGRCICRVDGQRR